MRLVDALIVVCFLPTLSALSLILRGLLDVDMYVLQNCVNVIVLEPARGNTDVAVDAGVGEHTRLSTHIPVGPVSGFQYMIVIRDVLDRTSKQPIQCTCGRGARDSSRARSPDGLTVTSGSPTHDP